MTFFLICGAVGFVLVLISLFAGFGEHDFHIDHDFDHDGGVEHGGDSEHDSGPSFFSFRVIVTFLTAFGATGAICTYYGCSPLWSSIIGFVAGIVFGLFAWWLMKQAFKQQASSLVLNEDLKDQTAMVHTAIPAGGNMGEVIVEVRGQRKYYPAKASDDTAIPLGSVVIVREVLPSALIVELKK